MTATGPTIFVIEDEPKIARLLSDYLQRENYVVRTFEEGTNIVESIREEAPALILLDLMLPGKDGLTICREVRQFSQIPIIMITAKVDEIDRLIGLELGADDYVCKPFSPREVMARVKTILRRVQAHSVQSTPEDSLEFRNVILHLSKYECTAGGHRVELTPVEFRILTSLLRRPGHVFSRNRLMEAAYTDDRIVSDRTIDTHIKNVRKKLATALPDDEILHSIYGVGYKIE